MAKFPIVLQRLLTAATLGLVFMVTASVFVPDWSRADPAPETDVAPITGPLIGTLEGTRFTVEIHGTDAGPRYTVRLTSDGAVLAEGLTVEQVAERFPELPLEHVDLSPDSPTLLMMADEDPAP